jgi:hypothetical protein
MKVRNWHWHLEKSQFQQFLTNLFLITIIPCLNDNKTGKFLHRLVQNVSALQSRIKIVDIT